MFALWEVKDGALGYKTSMRPQGGASGSVKIKEFTQWHSMPRKTATHSTVYKL